MADSWFFVLRDCAGFFFRIGRGAVREPVYRKARKAKPAQAHERIEQRRGDRPGDRSPDGRPDSDRVVQLVSRSEQVPRKPGAAVAGSCRLVRLYPGGGQGTGWSDPEKHQDRGAYQGIAQSRSRQQDLVIAGPGHSDLGVLLQRDRVVLAAPGKGNTGKRLADLDLRTDKRRLFPCIAPGRGTGEHHPAAQKCFALSAARGFKNFRRYPRHDPCIPEGDHRVHLDLFVHVYDQRNDEYPRKHDHEHHGSRRETLFGAVAGITGDAVGRDRGSHRVQHGGKVPRGIGGLADRRSRVRPVRHHLCSHASA